MNPRRDKGLAVPATRLGRLSRLGALTAGVAGNMAMGGMAQLGRGERPDWRGLLMTPKNVTRIADELSKMRGAAMKIGQLVSMDTGDVLPPELSQIMARLRDNADFMPPAQLKKVLAAQWPDGWLKDFSRFDVRPIAAASIGQVHRATLRDGRELAIKVQYPGVARSIDSDVANVGALIRMSGMLPKGFELEPYLAEAARQLHEETDYVREAHYLTAFQELLAGEQEFIVPKVHADWSTHSILAMDFVTSKPIEEALSENKEQRNSITQKFIRLFLSELFNFRMLQSDPNFANYRYVPSTGDIVLLDFGATREISKDISRFYLNLLKAGLSGERDKLEDLFISIGILNENTDFKHRGVVLDLAQMVFDRLRAPEFDFADTAFVQSIQSAGEALVRDGFVPTAVPMELLYVQRKLGGMFLLGAKLKARLPLSEMLADYLVD